MARFFVFTYPFLLPLAITGRISFESDCAIHGDPCITRFSDIGPTTMGRMNRGSVWNQASSDFIICRQHSVPGEEVSKTTLAATCWGPARCVSNPAFHLVKMELYYLPCSK